MNTSDDQGPPLRSLVLLLGHPWIPDQSIITAACERALSRVFNDAQYFARATGREGFIFVHTPSIDIGIASVASPYFPDIAKTADAVRLYAAKTAVQQHKAFLAIDQVGDITATTPDQAYDLIGKLAAQLLTDNVLGIVCPDLAQIAPVQSSTRQFLQTGNPRQIFSLPPEPHLVQVRHNDPELVAAEAEARRRFPEFLAAFAMRKPRQGFAVKTRFADEHGAEHMWVEVTSIEQSTLHGKLASDPQTIANLREGDPVSVTLCQVEDWLYSAGTHMVGGFTAEILQKRQTP